MASGNARGDHGAEVSGQRKTGLGPVAHADARLFILGSLPGDASLAARQYYAHPTNQFWRLLESVIGDSLHCLAYQERLARLAEHRIGLWDVVASATRRGSLDQTIRSADHNRIEMLQRDFPELRAIAFNGSKAATIGRRLLAVPDSVPLIDLPSSSAANTLALAAKAQAWSVLAQFL